MQGSRRLLAVLGAQALIALVAAAPSGWAGTMDGLAHGQRRDAPDQARRWRNEIGYGCRSSGRRAALRHDQRSTDLDRPSGCHAARLRRGTSRVRDGARRSTAIVIRPGWTATTSSRHASSVVTRDLAGADRRRSRAGGRRCSRSIPTRSRSSPLGGDGSDDFFESGPAVDRLERRVGQRRVRRAGLGERRDARRRRLRRRASTATAAPTSSSTSTASATTATQRSRSTTSSTASRTSSGGDGDDVMTGDDGLNDLIGGRRLRPARRVAAASTGSRATSGFGRTAATTPLLRPRRPGRHDRLRRRLRHRRSRDDIDIVFQCEDRQSIPDLQPDRDGDGDRQAARLQRPRRHASSRAPSTGPATASTRTATAPTRSTPTATATASRPASTATTNRARSTPARASGAGTAIDEDCDGVADPFAAFPTVALLSTRIGAAHRDRRARARRS